MIWNVLKHFSANENWGDANKMDPKLLKMLDNYRGVVNEKIFISCGTQGLHVPNSLHYQGKAVDILFPSSEKSLFDCYLIAEKFNFTGIGLYPDWQFGGKRIGGMHLDLRVSDIAVRWIGVKEMNQTVYIALNEQNLKATKLI